VHAAELLDEACARPEGFDLAAHWEGAEERFRAGLPRYPAVLRVDASLVGRLRGMWRFARIERVDAPDADGWARAEVMFEDEWEACGYVLGAGRRVEVLDPPALRERVAEEASAVAARYGSSARTTPGESSVETQSINTSS
jgi:predicted DNA-binding transcriptional regulator YafY